ncbi:MAG: alpha-hydroxy-acid oxidizing protein [Candidatus Eremiobacteraeota bacterium]|nr:alpha-hydroxy-acid oxidizing protein [Candidatus Eremiobacteraeota bacterium]
MIAKSRFPRTVGLYQVNRSDRCIACATCAEVCSRGVHRRVLGHNRMCLPESHLCIGPECAELENSCISLCPTGALSIQVNPAISVLGDLRWTPEIILATYHMAMTGDVPPGNRKYQKGRSGGGFDVLDFETCDSAPRIDPGVVDLSLSLNRRGVGRDIKLPVPFYGGGMSFGSISLPVMIARAKAVKEMGIFTCTGEGGYPDELLPYADHVITQIATGLFGVREQTIKLAPVIEFKYAQGAKPGLGGHLLADKVTPEVAHIRQSVPWRSLFSPFPFHSVYSVEDHKKHLDWVKTVNPDALISVKVSTPSDVDMVAVGSYYAGANIIHIDGGYGGTGASPEISKKNIAMPLEYAIRKAHKFLEKEGVRDKITLIASGGIRNPYDIAKAIAMGADGVVLGTAELIALECVRCRNCESGRGCPRGIATTDPELCGQIDPEWGKNRILNLYRAYEKELKIILARLGIDSINKLRGRMDLLRFNQENEE